MTVAVLCKASQLEAKKVIDTFSLSNVSSSEHELYMTKENGLFCDSQTLSYIRKTKNEDLKKIRALAYLSLFATLKTFFSAEGKVTHEGKPEFIYNEQADGEKKKLYISISHTDKITLVAVSDEGEIGVDIEGVISPEKADRVEKRYLENVEIRYTGWDIPLFYYDLESNSFISLDHGKATVGTLSENSAQISDEENVTDDHGKIAVGTSAEYSAQISSDKSVTKTESSKADFCNGIKLLYDLSVESMVSDTGEDLKSTLTTVKWTALEALLKCDGRGFAAFKEVNEISDNFDIRSTMICIDGGRYALSLSIKHSL